MTVAPVVGGNCRHMEEESAVVLELVMECFLTFGQL